MPATYDLVSSINVPAGLPSTISFTSIPQTATDFVVVGTLKTNDTVEIKNVTVQLNSTNPDRGYSLGADISGGTNVDSSFRMPIKGSAGGSYPTLSYSSHRFYVANYSSSTRRKMMLTQSGIADGNQTNPPITQFGTGRWNVTSPITSFSITISGYGFVQFSSLSLYLIKQF